MKSKTTILAFCALLSSFAVSSTAELDVKLLPSPFLDNAMRERAFMDSLDVRALTRMFRVTSGLANPDDDTGVYRFLGGWESDGIELRGHTCGHWLSGMASLYELTRDERVKTRAAEVVHILSECQKANGNGYLSAFPESDIDKIIRGERVWAPWYVLHKILAGLIDQYEICANAEALDVARKFGDWMYAKVVPLSAEETATMKRREFGGIRESLIRLAAIAGDAKYRKAADVFIDGTIYGPLNGKHANTLIPKVIADARSGSKEDALRFWNDVTAHYMYAPGCVSTKEAFRGPNRQAEFLTGVTGETYCTYNLPKLSRLLFDAYGYADFADYQERAVWNHILGQMEPIDGRLTYFLPVMTGSYKLQNRSNDSFWCCVGSAMESHTRYQRLVFAERNGSLYVNNFIPAEIKWNGLTLRLDTRFPEEESARLVVLEGDCEATINIRRPFWLANHTGHSDYDSRSRRWKKGDTIEIPLPCRFHEENAGENRTAVFYGPILMAARLGVEGIRKDALRSTNYYTHDYSVPEKLSKVVYFPPETWRRLDKPASPDPGMDGASPEPAEDFAEPSFMMPSGLVVAPLSAIHGERYAVYFNRDSDEP